MNEYLMVSAAIIKTVSDDGTEDYVYWMFHDNETAVKFLKECKTAASEIFNRNCEGYVERWRVKNTDYMQHVIDCLNDEIHHIAKQDTLWSSGND